MRIPFYNKKPTEPGQYLYFGLGVELINVRMVPEQYHGGVKFDEYLGVMEHGGRAVSRLNGKFSEKIEAYFD